MTPTRIEYAAYRRRAVVTPVCRGAWTVERQTWVCLTTQPSGWGTVSQSAPMPRKAAERLAVAWCEEEA